MLEIPLCFGEANGTRHYPKHKIRIGDAA